MTLNKENIDTVIEREMAEFSETLISRSDTVFLTLKFHLLTENMLERIIRLKLKRGDRIIDSARMSFHQKLCLVDSFDIIDDSTISSIKKINNLRNACVHKKEKKILLSDVDELGSPLGKKYIELKHRINNGSEAMRLNLLVSVFGEIYTELLKKVLYLENSLI